MGDDADGVDMDDGGLVLGLVMMGGGTRVWKSGTKPMVGALQSLHS